MKTKNALSILIASILLFSCASMGTGVPTKVDKTETMEESMREFANDIASLHDDIQIAYKIESASVGFASLKSYPKYIIITQPHTPILKGADANSGTLSVAAFGESYRVVDKVEPWYAVKLASPKKGFYSGWLNAKAVTPAPSPHGLLTALKASKSQVSEEETSTDRLYLYIVSKVVAFRQKWEKNQYLKVSGFSIDIGIPPSASIDFEFK